MSETKEQQECPYCHGDGVVINGDYMQIEIDGQSRAIAAYGDRKAMLLINYCPMCGRKLVHDEN